MTTQTARLALPLIEPGQAQKELFHNEALALIDIGVQAAVVATGTNAPPPAPAPGECWIVGGAPTGAWAGQARALAGWTAGGWRFVAAREGLAAWDLARRIPVRFVEGSWEAGIGRVAEMRIGGQQVVGARGAGIAAPAGGGTVDAEARTAIAAVLAALRTHGLIAA